jgi:hypothetical protein
LTPAYLFPMEVGSIPLEWICNTARWVWHITWPWGNYIVHKATGGQVALSWKNWMPINRRVQFTSAWQGWGRTRSLTCLSGSTAVSCPILLVVGQNTKLPEPKQPWNKTAAAW